MSLMSNILLSKATYLKDFKHIHQSVLQLAVS